MSRKRLTEEHICITPGIDNSEVKAWGGARARWRGAKEENGRHLTL